MPGPGHARIGEEEKAAVLEVVASGHLSRYGRPDDPAFKKTVYTFERELAAACGVVTDEDARYERAFAIHDQGHRVAQGKRG